MARTPNWQHTTYKGFEVSWIPIPGIDYLTNLPMDFIQRLKEERAQLAERVDKLSAFIQLSKFPELSLQHQELLSQQLHHMVRLS